jgi:DNA topoisomerase-3
MAFVCQGLQTGRRRTKSARPPRTGKLGPHVQLIVAEKPSVARDLARVLGVRGGGKHALEGAGRVLTWCIGHLVELEEPAAYDGAWKAWRLDTLPMIPETFKLRPVAGTRDQLRVVRELLRDRRFTEVVNACDAGREGELIFRYVYELAGSRLPMRRLWVSSLTDEAIRAGFAGLRPGADFDALGAAARSRSEADWLVGMNATRAVTVSARFASPRPRSPTPPPRQGQRAQRAHSDSPLYSIGRVQTPTLAIIVRREQEIRQFEPRDYWEVRGVFAPAGSPGEKVTATWRVALPDAKTTRSRLGTRALADAIVARDAAEARAPARHGPVVERLRQRRVREPPPLLFDLTSLQRTANRRYGLSATATLAAAQALYERYKILTYPRTDSRHLTTDLGKELPKMFSALAALPDYAPFAQPLLETPPARSRRVFDDGKVSDHHAIIPTGKPIHLEELPRDERRVFDLVARRFLGAFHPDAEFALTDVEIRVGAPAGASPAVAAVAAVAVVTVGAGAAGEPDEALVMGLPPPPDRYFARGRVRLVAGWQAVAQLGDDERKRGDGDGGERKRGDSDERKRADAEGDGESGATLPPLTEGQRLEGRFEALTKQTRPPPRHTEASLLGAMESAGRDIADEDLRAAMRDSGLGTPATRASTIETLIRRTFVAREGKNLLATPLGIGLIDALPVKSLASPELTGAWEARLARVARGEETRATFMADISRYVSDMVSAIRAAPGASPSRAAQASSGASVSKPAHASPDASVSKPAPQKATPQKATRDGGAIKATPARSRAPKTPTEALACPRCHEGTLVAGRRGWGCSRWREGCAFVIWFEIGGRRISEAELGELVSKGKTRRRKWPAQVAGGADQNARLVLDLEAPRDAGAGRLDSGAGR